MPSTNVVDSSGWLEYLADGPDAGPFAAPLAHRETLIVPSLSVYEVFKRVLQQRDETAATSGGGSHAAGPGDRSGQRPRHRRRQALAGPQAAHGRRRDPGHGAPVRCRPVGPWTPTSTAFRARGTSRERDRSPRVRLRRRVSAPTSPRPPPSPSPWSPGTPPGSAPASPRSRTRPPRWSPAAAAAAPARSASRSAAWSAGRR